MAIFIWGTNFHLGKSYFVEDYCCPYCEHYDSTELFLVSDYAHVFYIPYLPLDKSGLALCSNCGKKISEINFSKRMLAVYKEERKKYRHPLKMYAGFLIIPGIFIAAFLAGAIWQLFNKITF